MLLAWHVGKSSIALRAWESPAWLVWGLVGNSNQGSWGSIAVVLWLRSTDTINNDMVSAAMMKQDAKESIPSPLGIVNAQAMGKSSDRYCIWWGTWVLDPGVQLPVVLRHWTKIPRISHTPLCASLSDLSVSEKCEQNVWQVLRLTQKRIILGDDKHDSCDSCGSLNHPIVWHLKRSC